MVVSGGTDGDAGLTSSAQSLDISRRDGGAEERTTEDGKAAGAAFRSRGDAD